MNSVNNFEFLFQLSEIHYHANKRHFPATFCHVMCLAEILGKFLGRTQKPKCLVESCANWVRYVVTRNLLATFGTKLYWF